MKKFFALILLTMLSLSLMACGSGSDNGAADREELTLPEYSVVSSSDYVRDGRLCVGYRVAVDADLTEAELNLVFDAVTDDDYYLHTVWFYSDAERAGVDVFDVAMFEEVAEGQLEITLAQ